MRAILAMPGNEDLAAAIAARLSVELVPIETRRFPDSESYVRIADDVAGRDVDIVCTLARPDWQFLALVFMAAAARELGAKSVNLIAPYLAYMRQDKRFRPGETISSIHFARLLSGFFDRLTTIDPHLHRYQDLGQIFTIPARALHAAPLLGDWIETHVDNALVIGPDAESEQWVAALAARAGAPHVVLRKQRFGDRNVEVSVPDLSAWAGRQPVLIDDVVSSGRTMIEAATKIAAQGFAKPYCLAVHALFADDSYNALGNISSAIVTTDTVAHPSNAVSVANLIADALKDF